MPKLRSFSFVCFLQHALTVEGARITYPDKMASNGIIHRIEKVLMPPVGTIVDVLTQDGSFKTLLAAVTAAGLAEALNGKDYINDTAFKNCKTFLILIKIFANADIFFNSRISVIDILNNVCVFRRPNHFNGPN